MFKIKLKTPRVSTTESFAVGDIIEVGNDEAFALISSELGDLVGKKQPEAPKKEENKAKKAK